MRQVVFCIDWLRGGAGCRISDGILLGLACIDLVVLFEVKIIKCNFILFTSIRLMGFGRGRRLEEGQYGLS
jgi:hypothetical protein